VKGIYDHALRLLENPTPLDGATSLVLLDNAIEAAFKMALDESGTNVKEDPKFPELLVCVLNIVSLAELKKCRLSLLRLHRARNGFQHHGLIPDLNTILSEYMPLTEQTLNEVSSREFGLEWKNVSLSLLIRDETVKTLYRKAEESFKGEDFVTAVAYLIYAFEVTKTIAKLKIFGAGLTSLRNKIKDVSHKDKVVVDYLTTLDEEIETFKLGVNYMDLRNYLDVAQNVGIDSILDEIPINKTEGLVIADFKKKLQEAFIDQSLLKEWYAKMRIAVLKFIIRSEANSRLSIDQFSKLANAVISGLSESFKKLSQSDNLTKA
jgi:hypothetical protein